MSRTRLVEIFAFISADDSESWVDINLCFRIIIIIFALSTALNRSHFVNFQRPVWQKIDYLKHSF